MFRSLPVYLYEFVFYCKYIYIYNIRFAVTLLYSTKQTEYEKSTNQWSIIPGMGTGTGMGIKKRISCEKYNLYFVGLTDRKLCVSTKYKLQKTNVVNYLKKHAAEPRNVKVTQV